MFKVSFVFFEENERDRNGKHNFNELKGGCLCRSLELHAKNECSLIGVYKDECPMTYALMPRWLKVIELRLKFRRRTSEVLACVQSAALDLVAETAQDLQAHAEQAQAAGILAAYHWDAEADLQSLASFGGGENVPPLPPLLGVFRRAAEAVRNFVTLFSESSNLTSRIREHPGYRN
eukprot:6470764-Amphidinium_carterae.1